MQAVDRRRGIVAVATDHRLPIKLLLIALTMGMRSLAREDTGGRSCKFVGVQHAKIQRGCLTRLGGFR